MPKAIAISLILTTSAIGLSVYLASMSWSGRNAEENAQLKDTVRDLEQEVASLQSAELGTSPQQATSSMRRPAYPAGSPEAVVASYAASDSWQKRLPFVKHTPGIEGRMARHYGDKTIRFDYLQIKSPTQTKVAVGDVVAVILVRKEHNLFGNEIVLDCKYYLERNKNGYAVLWEPSVGWLPIGWEAFRSSRPTEATHLQLRCKLTNNYLATQDKVKHTHYELEVCPDNIGYAIPLSAYVVRESSAGQKIFEVLRDGHQHPMVLSIHFRDKPDEDCVWVRNVASDRAYIYDKQMHRHYTSPLSAPKLPSKAEQTRVPFRLSELSARWTITRDVLGDQVLVVPEARFRVTAKSKTVITNLRIKVVYLELHSKQNVEILYEDTQFVVSSSDRPLEKGFSKVVLSKSARGYKLKTQAQRAITVVGRDAKAEFYYDTGNGFVKFETVPIDKKIIE